MKTFTKDTLKNEPADFRIGAIISDGMWYSLPKWRKLARVTESEINEWIDEHLADGSLVQSATGAKSYRFPLSSISDWYDKHNLDVNGQLVDFVFPPRIWDNMTETEGFLSAPLREIGIVSFSASANSANEVINALRGVARVREFEPGRYKAYCLNASYAREIIEDELRKLNEDSGKKIYSRSEAKRREMSDFTTEFANGLVMFYKEFGKTLVKKEMETIKIFLPDPEDQESQILMWVLMAIEKFDESTSVPFSGYLNSVLRRWPYDLPSTHLGKDLSSFQRQRSKALVSLKEKFGEKNFSNVDLADEMGLEQSKFNDLEEKHRVWTRTQNATTLTWEENSDEKITNSNMSGGVSASSVATDINLANKLSFSVIQAALNTNQYNDAFSIISQIDISEINMGKIRSVSETFIQELGYLIGVEGEA